MSGTSITSANCSQLTTSGKTREGALIASNIVLSVIMSFIAVASVLSNGLVIASVAKTPRLQKPANLLLCSLALTDFLTGLTAIPLFLATRLLFIHISVNMCVYQTVLYVYGFCFLLCVEGAFAQVCLMSWDRYKAVSSPLVYRSKASKRKTLKTIAVAWLMSGIAITILKIKPIGANYLGAVIGITFLTFPAVMQVATYKAMHHHNQEIVATNSQAAAATALAREKKVVTTLRYILVALLFSLAAPVILYVVMVSTKAVVNAQSDFVAWSNVLVFSNSCMNPMIYFLRHADMRKAAFRLIGH